MQLYTSSQSQIKHIVSTFRPPKDWAKKSPKALRHFKRKGPNLRSICEAYGFRALEVANEQYYEFRSARHRFAIPKDVQERVNCMIKGKASIDEAEAVDVNGIPSESWWFRRAS